MALSAGVGDPQWVHSRCRVGRRPNGMCRVAARAGRDLPVTEIEEPLTVDRRSIFGHLIDPQRRIVSPHESRVGMAPAAHLRDIPSIRRADIPLRAVFRSTAVEDRRVAAVTNDAAESLFEMDIVDVFADRIREPLVVDYAMTAEAAALLLEHLALPRGTGRPSCQTQHESDGERTSHVRCWNEARASREREREAGTPLASATCAGWMRKLGKGAKLIRPNRNPVHRFLCGPMGGVFHSRIARDP